MFSFSFIFIKSLGFLIIPAFILLFFLIKDLKKPNQTILYGALWGIIVFGLHFAWLYELLIFKTGASFCLATSLYLFILFYSGLLSSIYFLITKKLFNLSKNYFPYKILFNIKCFFLISTSLFFYFIERNFLFFLEKNAGYPFLNPLIPLAKYKWFLFLYSLIFSFNQAPINKITPTFFRDNKIIHLKPVIKSYNNKFSEEHTSVETFNVNVVTAGQMVYHQLASLNLNKYVKRYKNIILLAPETYFPYSLNKNKNIIKLWSNVLPENTYFFLGSQRKHEISNNSYKIMQSIYLLKSGRIIDYYDKKHRTLFAEKIPSTYKKYKWSSKLFLSGKKKFHVGGQIDKRFYFPGGLNIVPKVCSELFYKIDMQNINRADFIFFFANDSWFMPYFKQVMKNLTALIACEVRLPVFYINHSDLVIYNLQISA